MTMSLDLLLAWSAFLLASLACLKNFATLFSDLRENRPRDRFYVDSDGDGTPDTIAKFSNRHNKIAILSFSALGVFASSTLFMVEYLEKGDHEQKVKSALVAGSWVVILIHATCTAVTRSSIKAYTFGLWIFPSTLMLFTSSVQHVSNFDLSKSPRTIFWIINNTAGFFLALASISLPRRVDVVFEGCIVDRQRTVSALCRYTWGWIEPMLKEASTKGDIDFNDLFCADHRLRSSVLQQNWNSKNPQATLLRSLIKEYKQKLGVSWIITILRCLISLLPFWALRQALDILETREGRSIYRVELVSLVIGMALSNLLDAWIEGWLFWHSISALSLPIRAQLSSLIFAKSLHRKDIKTVNDPGKRAKKQDHQSENRSDQLTLEDDTDRSRQGVVNLVSVDTERIAYFVQFQFLIINSMVKLGILSVFLIQIIGWFPFSAGISAWLLIMPVSAWASNLLLARSKILMQLRDAKLAKLNEALLGIRQIKLSALESQWEAKLLALRNMELQTLWQYFLADIALFSCWILSHVLLAGTSLAVYVLVHGTLSPSVAFVSLGMFSTLESTLETLPELITLAVDTFVSIHRVDTYLSEAGLQNKNTPGPSISFQGATISWPSDDLSPKEGQYMLRNLDLHFPVGQLSIIAGGTGSGKSLLIAAILGEANLLEGCICVPNSLAPSPGTVYSEDWIMPGSLAYVSQTPWLDNGSLQDNILFGLRFVKQRYDQVIKACALETDLNTLVDRDRTELGANGVNLSGGQKWRVALARAIYSTAETLVLEDIFCAVDAHVGRWILEKCINGSLCKGRTRILVTHSLGLVLSSAAYIVELGGGTIIYSGPPSVYAGRDTGSDLIISTVEAESTGKDADIADGFPLPSQPNAARKFLLEEGREIGKVKWSVYLAYLKHGGGMVLWIACAMLFLAFQISILSRAWWIRIWTSEDLSNNFTGDPSIRQFIIPPLIGRNHIRSQVSSPMEDSKVFFYLNIYIIMSVVLTLVGIVRYFWVYLLSIKASKTIFSEMLFTVLHAPLHWLDAVPTGRIVNRFTTDLNAIDQRLPLSWTLFFTSLLRLVGICIASIFTCGYLIGPSLILLVLGIFIGSRYLKASRPLKRLESISRSPILDLFNTTLAGITTIRASNKTEIYLARMHILIDKWTMTTFYVWLANRWMSFRMALLAAAFCVSVGLVIVFDDSIDAALAGFMLSFVLDFSESMRWTVRCYGDLELEMNSMERVDEYMKLETEPLSGKRPPASWPTLGGIEFRKLDVAHGLNMPLVLKGISFRVRPKQRVAVVGRTGAGKSSLALALFRCLQKRGGSIIIDGFDISELTLHDLRSRMAIIPQVSSDIKEKPVIEANVVDPKDPILFSGTIRSNLDPFEEHSDSTLFAALVQVQLVQSQPAFILGQETSTNSSSIDFSNLSSPISESGGNLSQGQRQLLSIARAIISRPKIIVFDEATSAVDKDTDALVQRSIRSSFPNSTLLVIAHRLSTICDFDKIVVLDQGCVEEVGSPLELWENDGMFRAMCENSGGGETEKLRNSILFPYIEE